MPCQLLLILHPLPQPTPQFLPIIHGQSDVLRFILWCDTAIFVTQMYFLSSRTRDTECHVSCSNSSLPHPPLQFLPIIHGQSDVLRFILWCDTAIFVTQMYFLSSRTRDTECHVSCSNSSYPPPPHPSNSYL